MNSPKTFQSLDIKKTQDRNKLTRLATTMVQAPKHPTRRLKRMAKSLTETSVSEAWFREMLLQEGFLIQEFGKNRKKGKGSIRFYQNYILGNYVIDFVFKQQKVAIEIDDSSHQAETRKQKDHLKDLVVREAGFKVYRVKYEDEPGARKVISMLLSITGMHKRRSEKTAKLNAKKLLDGQRADQEHYLRQMEKDFSMPPI